MDYQEFTHILSELGYRPSSYMSCDCEFCTWYFYIYDGVLDDISVSYMYDENRTIRQQFNNTPNMVRLSVKDVRCASNWHTYTFKDCINQIIKNGYGLKSEVRKYRLNQVFDEK